MKIVVFTAEKFKFEDRHKDKLVSEFPSAKIHVAESNEALLKQLPSADVLICGNYNFRPDWLPAAKNLKWIHSLAAGNEKILPSLVDKPILLTDSSGVHSIPIAEQVLGYMLIFERALLAARKAQERREWASLELDELRGKSVLVLGLGAVGSRIASYCKLVGMNVLGTKRAGAVANMDTKAVADEFFDISELASCLPKVDYVVVALPSTKETYHLLGRAEFSMMKPTARLINIGRGNIIDEPELIAALEERKLAGAALDVFEQEPLPRGSPLWGMENVIITPHNAGLTPYYIDRVVEIFCINMKAYLGGKKMPNLVDKAKGY
ncbi:MAG TPA: D-2-hydroxyacid dehydrogenase [Candidatus Nanoarchaeia archaeon]|nr:D-2-hydroxyacid dehydrogenase [Candidatus Nanoarchaeia archaeon]